ncbi:MAG: DUF4349 domain-containing protein [Anaerolineae bacterium]
MSKRRWLPIALLMLAILTVTGCSAKLAQQIEPAQPAMEAPAPEADFGGERGMSKSDDSAVEQEQLATGAAYQVDSAGERMIIRTVNMSLVVEDTEKVLRDLSALVKSHNGYVASSNSWHSEDQLYANVTLRVPAGSLDAVLESVRGMVISVDSENLSGQDVTEEYTDLQARLRNLEATERELQALLTEVRENRGKADEILAIYRELTIIRGEIESMKGRAQYLERMTALATIQMDIRPKAAPRPVTTQRWSPLVTLSEALRGMLRFVTVLADVGIYLLIFSPIVLIPALVLWLIVRAARKRRDRNKAAMA